MNIKAINSSRQNFPQQKSLQSDNVNDRVVENESKIKKLSKEFESLFLDVVLKSMRNTVQKSGLIDGGHAENLYQSMLDSEYAKVMSEQGNNGLAEMIEKQLLGFEQKSIEGTKNIDKLQAKEAYRKTIGMFPK